jgi:hypothetical protein
MSLLIREQEQKLCDIGLSLADSVLASDSAFSSFEIGPRDLLRAVVKSLSSARNGQSHLLPKLLQHSQFVLGCSDPAAHIDAQRSLYDDVTGISEEGMAESTLRIINEITVNSDWTLGDDISIALEFI